MKRDNVTPIKPDNGKMVLKLSTTPDNQRLPVFYAPPPDTRGVFFTGMLWGLQAVTLILICVSIGLAL